MPPDIDFPSPSLEAPVLSALQLAVSTEPIVVFTSLAELITDSFAAHCQITLVDAEGHPHRISSSAATEQAGNDAAASDSAELSLPILPEDDSFSGTVGLSWHAAGHPSAEDASIAQLLIECATGLLIRERLRAQLLQQSERAHNLAGALESNRQIGKAIGILMASHKVTDEQAFALMRDFSQRSHRKIREIATHVADSGTLLDPDE